MTLEKMMGKYPNNMFVAEFANHEKVLVKDDTDLARREKNRIIRLMENNLVELIQ
ncbi:MAG: hypothetical protein HON83_02215 [Candidatus Marinimicrobia bacterium]|jgi:hypothetical protein|nr:hypothetical protein [Candidatus Neomarinimicrobiota bacterium]